MMHDREQQAFFRKIRAAALPLLVFAASWFCSTCALFRDAPADAGYTPVFVKPPKHLTDLCVTRAGDLWITAEAGGVFRVADPGTQAEWEDMRALPGFPATDHCTAVCEDSQGRIWVGTASLGVQVYSGGAWQRYDRDTVLSGSHIHDLASSSNGLTAVAHECSVSVYDARTDSWRDYSVLNGLPPGGVRGVCFGPDDTLHCATESGGYVQIDLVGTAPEAWRLTASDTWGRGRAVLYPLTENGDGLGSNFCNGISVDRSSGRVCIAGLNGISFGKDRSFRYLQGRDLYAKMRGAARPELISGESAAFLLSNLALKESYVNCVHYGRHGLWIGSDLTFSQLNQDNFHQKLTKAKLQLLELFLQKLLKTLFLLNTKLTLFHQKLSPLDFNPYSHQVLLHKLSKQKEENNKILKMHLFDRKKFKLNLIK